MMGEKNHSKKHTDSAKAMLSEHARNRTKPTKPSTVVKWIDLENEDKGVQVSLSIHRLAKDLQYLIKGMKKGRTLFKNRYKILSIPKIVINNMAQY